MALRLDRVPPRQRACMCFSVLLASVKTSDVRRRHFRHRLNTLSGDTVVVNVAQSTWIS